MFKASASRRQAGNEVSAVSDREPSEADYRLHCLSIAASQRRVLRVSRAADEEHPDPLWLAKETIEDAKLYFEWVQQTGRYWRKAPRPAKS